jgi:colanic acid/amylovoran biosynthesis glycosyltransferase
VIIAHFRRAFGAPSETFITEPIQHLLRRGVSNPLFTLLSLDPASSIPHVAMARTRGDGGRAVEQRSRRLPPFVSKVDFLGWPVARQWLRRQLVAARPDVLVSHFGPDGCLAAPVARRLGIPHVVFFYGYDVNVTGNSRVNIWSWLYPRLFRSADSLCTTSRYLAGRLHALGAAEAKQRVISVGVDTNTFSYADPADRFDGRVVRLLHVGRLTAKKSPLKLLCAVKEAAALCPELRLELTLAGDGELAGPARALARDLDLVSQVQFAGPVSRDQVRHLLAAHHLYTQYCETTPSGETEGLGVSFIEASACGLPIVTTRHNGLPEVVLDGASGLLSEEGDVSAMAQNIATLARDRGRWTTMGREGRRHVTQNFSLARQADTLLEHCTAVARGVTSPNGAATDPERPGIDTSN